MFLWVDLAYQELAKVKKATILRQCAETMPAGLTALYHGIFSRTETAVSGTKQIHQLEELFCYLAYFKEPPNVLLLNQLIQFAADDPAFDVESTIEGSCASLISPNVTGQLLFDKLTQLGLSNES